MKKWNNLIWSIAALASLSIMSSCGDEDSEDPAPASPTLTVDATGTADISGTTVTGEPGDEVTFQLSATTPGGFNVFRVTGLTPTYEETRNDLGLEAGATSATGTPFTVPLTSDLVGQSLTLEMLVVDDLNQQDMIPYTINVTSPEARAYTAILLSAPLGDLSATSFFSSNTGITYSPTDVTGTSDPVSATIDFGYYYGVDDNASLASPEAYSEVGDGVFSPQVEGWTVTNSISFRSTSTTSEEFVGITTWADIDAVYDAGTDENQVISDLTVDQVIAFETDPSKEGGSKRGVIWVKGITPGDGVLGEIEIEVVVQEEAN